MKNVATYILCLLIVVLPGCHMLSPEQRESGRIAIVDAYDKGQITVAQRDAALEGLEEGGSVDWGAIGMIGGSIIGSILLGTPISVGVAKRKAAKAAAKTA